MISEEPYDTEDCINTVAAENTAVLADVNYILKYSDFLFNCNNISQHYFYVVLIK